MPDNRLPDKLKSILNEKVNRVAKATNIAEAIRIGGGYRWVGIYDVDFQEGMVVNIAWSGSGPPAFPIFPITQGLTSKAIADRKTINVGDVATDSSYLTALDSTRAEIIVPVLSHAGEVIGTIDVESEQLDAFDTAAQILLEECSHVLMNFWTGGV